MDQRSAVTNAPVVVADDAQALIEEARRRHQRRRRWITAVVLVALVGTGVGIGVSLGTAAPGPSGHHGSTFASVPPGTKSSEAELKRPEALAVTSNGSLLIANQGTNQVLTRMPGGKLIVLAGTGGPGYSGDGGPAIKAELNDPGGMAVTPGGTIYVADTDNNRVRAILPSGTIGTVAGDGRAGSGGVGGPAVDAEVARPVAVALDTQGRLYIVDNAGVQVISSKGDLATVIPAGPGALIIGGAPTAFYPSALTVDRAGNFYVADSSPKLLIALSPTGHVLNSWPTYVSQAGLATAPNGSVLVADYGQFAVDRIVDRTLAPIVTFEFNSLARLSGTFRPSGVAASSAGQVYTDTDGVNGGSVQPALAAVGDQGHVEVLATGSPTSH